MSYKMKNTFSKRLDAGTNLRKKYPDRIPIIILNNSFEDVGGDPISITKTQYLVPSDITIGQFIYILRKRITLSSESAIFLLTENNEYLNGGETCQSAYDKYKDKDLHLYLILSSENAFGKI